jgi:hypothetical protein
VPSLSRLAADDHREGGGRPERREQRDDSDGVGGGLHGAEAEAEGEVPVVRQHCRVHGVQHAADQHARAGEEHALSQARLEERPVDVHRVGEEERWQEDVEERVAVDLDPGLDASAHVRALSLLHRDHRRHDADRRQGWCVRQPRADPRGGVRDQAANQERSHRRSEEHGAAGMVVAAA